MTPERFAKHYNLPATTKTRDWAQDQLFLLYQVRDLADGRASGLRKMLYRYYETPMPYIEREALKKQYDRERHELNMHRKKFGGQLKYYRALLRHLDTALTGRIDRAAFETLRAQYELTGSLPDLTAEKAA